MKITERTKPVRELLADFMHAIEAWQSMVEGTPTENDLKELDKIYQITEVELRFTVNNDRPEDDDE